MLDKVSQNEEGGKDPSSESAGCGAGIRGAQCGRVNTGPVFSSEESCILLVEDTASTALVLKAFLLDQGFGFHCCPDGESALEVLATTSFAAVILDVILPKLNGVQILKRMRSMPHHKETPVIVISTVKQKSVQDEVTALGALGCLDKTQPAQLLTQLRRLIPNTSQPQPLG